MLDSAFPCQHALVIALVWGLETIQAMLIQCSHFLPSLTADGKPHRPTHIVLASGVSFRHTRQGREIPSLILIRNFFISAHKVSWHFSMFCSSHPVFLWGLIYRWMALLRNISSLFGIAPFMLLSHALADWHHPMSMCVRAQQFHSDSNESLPEARQQNIAIYLFMCVCRCVGCVRVFLCASQ